MWGAAVGSGHRAPSMGPGVGTSHGHGTGHGDRAWGHPVGSSRGDHPWGLPVAVGLWGRGSRAGGWKRRPSPPHPCCHPGDHGPGDNRNITMGVLGCSGWGVLGAAQPPVPPGGFCPFLSPLTFTFSQKPLPATCKRRCPRPPSRLPPTPFLSRHGSPFGWQMSLRGFWTPPPPPAPVQGGCWPHAGPCPPPRAAAGGTPQPPLRPGLGPRPPWCPSQRGCVASPALSSTALGTA